MQQPNHIPESLNCLLAIEWFKQRLNLVLLPFAESIWGGDTSQHIPWAASVLFCHLIDHTTHCLIICITESTVKRLVQCPHRSTSASEEGPCFLYSLVFSFHLAKSLGVHVFIHEVKMERSVGQHPSPSPSHPQQCCCFVGLVSLILAVSTTFPLIQQVTESAARVAGPSACYPL